MGKSYIENSLKRFLKRKVKITLGLVVTFLITGSVGFATENDVEAANKFKEDLKNQNIKIEEIKTNLQGLGSSNLENGKYKVKKDGTGAEVTIKVSYDKNTGINKIEIPSNISSLVNIEIKDSLLTDKVKKVIEGTLQKKVILMQILRGQKFKRIRESFYRKMEFLIIVQ